MAIENFERLMDEFNAAVTSATSPEEQLKITAEFEKKIDAAEKELEAAIEAQFNAEIEALEKEQREAEPVDDIEESLLEEINSEFFLLMISDAKKLTQEVFVKTYKVKDIRSLATALNISTRDERNKLIKEVDLVAYIYKVI